MGDVVGGDQSAEPNDGPDGDDEQQPGGHGSAVLHIVQSLETLWITPVDYVSKAPGLAPGLGFPQGPGFGPQELAGTRKPSDQVWDWLRTGRTGFCADPGLSPPLYWGTQDCGPGRSVCRAPREPS